MVSPLLTSDQVASRRGQVTATNRVMFRVAALYGLSPNGMQMPLNETESVASGQICVTMDPDAGPEMNVGVIDYEAGLLKVCYGAQLVFPGLYRLLKDGKHDPSLFDPVRATATDRCTLTPDYTGWHALGCLEFLPGSFWAGAEGG